jgi:two-component system response regulator
MQDGMILLVEDNQDDIDLTIRAFEKNNISNRFVIARDGVEALEHLFGAGAGAGAGTGAGAGAGTGAGAGAGTGAGAGAGTGAAAGAAPTAVPADRVWPVVVLLDLKLPRIDGLEVLRKIRADARTRTLPVVVLTSSDEQRDLIESYNLGANSYVRKPVDFNGFIEAARQLGLYWLVLNQPPPKQT